MGGNTVAWNISEKWSSSQARRTLDSQSKVYNIGKKSWMASTVTPSHGREAVVFARLLLQEDCEATGELPWTEMDVVEKEVGSQQSGPRSVITEPGKRTRCNE